MCKQKKLETVTIKYTTSSQLAIRPKRATTTSVGLDLFSPLTTMILPQRQHLINTELKFQIPPTHYGQLETKSGMAYNCGVFVMGGVIDSDYRGDVGVILSNASEYPYTIQQGEGIAQMVLHKAIIPELKEVEMLDPTFRGSRGFGEMDALVYQRGPRTATWYNSSNWQD